MKLIVHCPLNSLSLGQVSYNILRELYKRKVQVVLFPKSDAVDLGAYRPDPPFSQWLERAVQSRFTKLDRKVPTLMLWHINESQFKASDRQVLFSFHETDAPTEHELNLVNQQDHTFFSSSWTVDKFQTYGAPNVSFAPLGLDEDFVPAEVRRSPHLTHWVLIGKAEQRKNTQLIIQTWLKRYANKPSHRLTLCITNPFFKPEVMDTFYRSCFPDGKRPANVNVLPYLKTNAEVAQLANATDIDLSGFSSAEGWNLPAFNATALGKWSIVTNCSAHRDWATPANSILVDTSEMRPVYDNIFFRQGAPFNQGNIYKVTAEQLEEAMGRAEKLAKVHNDEGAKLRETHTYAKTVDAILAKL